MLKLKGIKKDYEIADMKVKALRGIDLCFRKSEFVSILGPSGCGKTTLLNIIGGLDRYTEGDLVINGKSTKEYGDREWDSYRNHKIGFVFQTYNLIPHQTVLSNVELALTISGVSKVERKRRAKEALEKVGLGDQLNKKPNQMSGGQQQRVAIARALVNDPDIILADEPTGALDTETSVQIMEILKNISDNKLIIMVTHNPELANTYSNRIVRLVDGKLTDDSNPYTDKEYEADFNKDEAVKKEKSKKKQGHGKVSMSFATAFGLSLNNLLTKKGRTLLTSFAGSIGIIGIALILALSNGIQGYIDSVQRDTLTSYPVQITSQTMDYTSLLSSMQSAEEEIENREPDKVYTNTMMLKLLSTISSEIKQNNLSEFKKYLESGVFDEYINAVKYGYTANMQIYSYNAWHTITEAPHKNQQVYPSTIVSDMMELMGGSVSSEMSSMATSMYNMEVWSEIIEGKNGEIVNPLIEEQYEILGDSRLPENYDEIVIVLTKDNQISDLALYSMGIKDKDEMKDVFEQIAPGGEGINEEKTESMEFSYDDLLGLRFKVVLPGELYEDEDNDGVWTKKDNIDEVIEEGVELKVVGVIRPKEETVSASISGTIGYTTALTEYVVEQCAKSEIMKAQQDNPDVDIFTGKPFEAKVYNKDNTLELLNDIPEQMAEMLIAQINSMMEGMPNATTVTTKEEAAALMAQVMSDEDIAKLAEQMIGTASGTYDSNMTTLGYCDLNKPTSISIYASTFEAKEGIADLITRYNKAAEDDGNDDNIIRYTDFAALMMSSFSDIIDFVSYGLIAFVSVSLVVSSIMIGIITYISVLERTKEIGVLRAIGASKHDVSNVFNAETFIVGLTSGVLGILATLLVSLPVNIIFEHYTDIANIASLPPIGAAILIGLSIVLTLVAGLIPAFAAAKKDPVTALRTE